MSVEEREWLDGPGFCAWLEEHGSVPTESILGFRTRAVRRWRQGSAASVWVADEVLTRFGFHLSELPDDLWRENPMKDNGQPISSRVRRAALAAVRRGDAVSHVAKRFAIDESTIRSWMREEKVVVFDWPRNRKKVAA